MSTITKSPTKAPDTGKHRAGKPAKPVRPVKAAKPAKPTRVVSQPVNLVKTQPTAPARKRHPKLRLLALLLLVAVTIGSAVVAFLVQRSNSHTRSLQAVESARKSAVAAAATDIPKILGYDYRHLTGDITAAKAISTGQFLGDYTSTAQKVLASAPSIKAIVTATVSGQSVVQAQSDRVTLLLFVDQESVKQLKGQKTATTRIDPFRVQVTMSKVAGHWMVSNLEPI
jgi:Mce-associated membrane protein